MAHATDTKRPTRIQIENRRKILDAALIRFSGQGYAGVTLDEIAADCGMSKPNLIYYFPSKDEIYGAVLHRTLADWLEPLEALDPEGEPLDEIWGYVRRKLAMSRERPVESRLFAGEVLRGAPVIAATLSGTLKALVDKKAAVIQRWIDQGRLAPHDPRHLIFAIWATTQHYADFDVQVQAVLGPDADEGQRFAAAERMLKLLILGGLRA